MLFTILTTFIITSYTQVSKKTTVRFNNALAIAAKSLESWDIKYNGDYYAIDYPMGDVPDSIGVCTDVVIRAYRELQVDLQELIHEDIKRTREIGLNCYQLTNDKIINFRIS